MTLRRFRRERWLLRGRSPIRRWRSCALSWRRCSPRQAPAPKPFPLLSRMLAKATLLGLAGTLIWGLSSLQRKEQSQPRADQEVRTLNAAAGRLDSGSCHRGRHR